MMRAELIERPIDVGALIAEVSANSTGAATIFLGTVRDVNAGRPVLRMEYSSYPAMAVREMESILGETATRFGIERAVVVHRVGTLELGEASVAIVVAHAHRGPALDASRYIIEELKRRVPIWKREHYADGTREWVDPMGHAVEVPVP